MGLPDKSGFDLHSNFRRGALNKITDVPGVRAANVTITNAADAADVEGHAAPAGSVNTGVTAILPHTGNLFREKVAAGCAVINGFGKSAGLIQIEELGTIETPIIMTNTFSVGTASTALIRYMLEQNEDIGVSTSTVNPVVTECNDGSLNDIRGFHVSEGDVLEALRRAKESGEDFEEGAVGGGRGMCCLGFKGGIGSASRVLTLDGSEYTVGAIVMANFGSAGHLTVGGRHLGEELQRRAAYNAAGAAQDGTAGNSEDDAAGTSHSGDFASRDKGSIIMVVGTDVPLSSRQLSRVARRAAIALGRCGSYMGNGSGDICIAFSTANKISHYSDKKIITYRAIYEDAIDEVFEAAVESIEEAIISALWHAETVTGVRGKTSRGLRDCMKEQKAQD